jgi:cysteine rich repeat protein
VQRVCPESLDGEARGRCVESHVKRLAPVCQTILRQRLVGWKEAEGYNVACLDDLQRLCSTLQAGEGQALQCLQDHAQEVSDSCYRSLPKGQLLLQH